MYANRPSQLRSLNPRRVFGKDPFFESRATMTGYPLRRCRQIGVAIFLEACAEFDLTPLQFAMLQSLVNGGA